MVDGISSTTWNWNTLLQSATNSTSRTTGQSSALQALLDHFQSSGQQPSQPKDPLEELVTDGTLTSDQADAVKQALQAAMQSGIQPGNNVNPLADLIANGTITQDQADSVKSVLDANRPDGGRSSLLSSVLNKLVSAGTLTQDQADEVKSELSQGMHRRHSMPPPQSTQASSTDSNDSDSISLSSLSEDEITTLLMEGKITASEAQRALENLQGGSGSSDATSATGTQLKAESPFEKLVSQGVLTSEQADDLRTALQQAMQSSYAAQAYTRSAATEL